MLKRKGQDQRKKLPGLPQHWKITNAGKMSFLYYYGLAFCLVLLVFSTLVWGGVFEHFLGVSDSNTLLKLYFPILCGLLCDADNKEINTTGYSE